MIDAVQSLLEHSQLTGCPQPPIIIHYSVTLLLQIFNQNLSSSKLKPLFHVIHSGKI